MGSQFKVTLPVCLGVFAEVDMCVSVFIAFASTTFRTLYIQFVIYYVFQLF